jgi:hypothetical protein
MNVDIRRAERAAHKALNRGLLARPARFTFTRRLRNCGVRAKTVEAAHRLATLHGVVDDFLTILAAAK